MKYSDQNCQQDYLVIPGGSQTGLDRDRQFSYDRFCGSTLGVCGIQATGQATCQEIIGPVVSKFKYQHFLRYTRCYKSLFLAKKNNPHNF